MKIILSAGYVLLTFTFIGLKAVEVITWPWLLALFPITIPATLIVTIFIVAIIKCFAIEMQEKIQEKKRRKNCNEK